MCSLEEKEDELIGRLSLTNNDGEERVKCCKCKSASGEVIIRHATYCKGCFMITTLHKFRLNFAKGRAMVQSTEKDNILIGISGTYKSRALLHAISDPMRRDSNRRILTQYHVCHIYDPSEGRPDPEDSFSKLCSTYNMTYTQVHINEILELPNFKQMVAGKDSISELVKSIKSVEYKSDLIAHGKRRLLRKVASKLGCPIIVTEETGTDTACNLFSAVSKGNGHSLTFETGAADLDFCQDQVAPAAFIRPFREHLDKELVFYNYWEGLYDDEVMQQSWSISAKSIQSFTKGFFISLDRDYPSTVSTVVRTSTKIKTKTITNSDPSTVSRCKLCDRQVQPNAATWIHENTIQTWDQLQKAYNSVDFEEESLTSDSMPSYCYTCSRFDLK